MIPKLAILRRSGLLTLALGVFFLYQSLKLELGSWNEPGPGLWPLLLSLLVLTASFVLLIGNSEGGAGSEKKPFAALLRDSRLPLAAIASLVLFIVLSRYAGLTLAGGIMLLAWLRLLGKEKWTTSIVVAAGLTALCHVLFAVALQVPLPEDWLLALWSAGR
ncbi:tripartite tricarboxylate transporter TctB family protein [Cohnella faecalis]|uniref:Tripartite tricarboxylate transporter TctB family protein n=1 Tax=Cohnella faecalis TaxID=2315694 RepID=A0A398CR32_9BACL|nr:tripartite tricarboxylate transporter TctB family protein [Cohnella faecalis]RIE03248.1 tripartite tricarboxylate transporter TctB family protein [Cohnella faecalis]